MVDILRQDTPNERGDHTIGTIGIKELDKFPNVVKSIRECKSGLIAFIYIFIYYF